MWLVVSHLLLLQCPHPALTPSEVDPSPMFQGPFRSVRLFFRGSAGQGAFLQVFCRAGKLLPATLQVIWGPAMHALIECFYRLEGEKLALRKHMPGMHSFVRCSNGFRVCCRMQWHAKGSEDLGTQLHTPNLELSFILRKQARRRKWDSRRLGDCSSLLIGQKLVRKMSAIEVSLT